MICESLANLEYRFKTNGPANSGTTVPAALIGVLASGHNYPRLHRSSVLRARLLVAELDEENHRRSRLQSLAVVLR